MYGIMKKFLILSAAMILCGCITSVAWTGKKDATISEVRQVAYFDSFSSSGSFDVFYVQSKERKVVVEGKEEFVKKLKTDVFDKTLRIKMEKGQYYNLVLKVTVYAPEIEDIEIHGSGDIRSESIIVPGKDLELSVSGSGDIIIREIKCKELDIDVMGSGDAWVTSANVEEDIDLSVKGSGDISINGQCRKVEAYVAGSGDITGKLKYAEIKKNVYGSGSIKF